MFAHKSLKSMLHLPKIPKPAVGVGSGAVYKNGAPERISVTQKNLYNQKVVVIKKLKKSVDI